jgi:hypothetical protein
MDRRQKPRNIATSSTRHRCKGCAKSSCDSTGSGNQVVRWPQSPLNKAVDSTISNVQIAIEDHVYAEQLRGLLEEDSAHRAYVVDRPDPAIDGVMVLDETTLGDVPVPAGRDGMRYLVLGSEVSDPNKLWNAGVRRLLPAKHPPELVRIAILSTELILSQKTLPGMSQTDHLGEGRPAAEV